MLLTRKIESDNPNANQRNPDFENPVLAHPVYLDFLNPDMSILRWRTRSDDKICDRFEMSVENCRKNSKKIISN